MEKETKKSKKKVLIIIVAVFIFAIILALFMQYQLNWKGYKTYNTDKFSIKYQDTWEVKDEASDKGDVKNFTDNNDNSVRVISMPKSEMPENQNTLEKFKDNIIKQMKESIANAFFNGEPYVEKVTKDGNNGIKITFQYRTGEKLIYIMYEKNDIVYSMVLQGNNTEIFDKMIESLEIK